MATALLLVGGIVTDRVGGARTSDPASCPPQIGTTNPRRDDRIWKRRLYHRLHLSRRCDHSSILQIYGRWKDYPFLWGHCDPNSSVQDVFLVVCAKQWVRFHSRL